VVLDNEAILPGERVADYDANTHHDWGRIKAESRPMRALLAGLTFLKLSLPTLELTSGGVRGHLLYY
jgi:hypothetical protein